MNTATFSNSEGTVLFRQGKRNCRIMADSVLAAQLDYPFTTPRTIDGKEWTELFDADGKRFADLTTMATSFELNLNFVEEPATTEATATEAPLENEVSIDIQQVFTFRSIEDLRRTWRQANSVAQRELKLFITGRITQGKERVEKAKKWLEGPLDVENLEVASVRTKWIFFVETDRTLFAKDLSDATFRFE